MLFRFFLALCGVVVGGALERESRRRRRKNPVRYRLAEKSSELVFGQENALVLEACARTLEESHDRGAAEYLRGYAAAIRAECGRRRAARRIVRA